MRKNFSILAALTLAVSFVCVSTVFTACSEQKAIEPEPIVKMQTKYVPVENTVAVGNYGYWDGMKLVVNGQTALTASVYADSLCLTKPAADHKKANIKDFLGDNRWSDTNGNFFTGNLHTYEVADLTVGAAIEPATSFSSITKIHEKVSMISCDFRLKGNFEFLLQDGKVDKQQFDLPMPVVYFLCDTTVEVRVIDDTTVEIKDSLITEYVHVNKDLAIVNGFGFGSIDFTVGDKSFKFRLNLDSTLIHRNESEWGIATKTDENTKGFSLSDKQVGTYTVKEKGINLESVSFVGTGASFTKLNDSFKYGTTSVKVVVSYTNEKNEKVTRDFTVSASYFHEKAAQPEPEVIVPDVTINHVYDVDSTHTAVYQDGKLIGVKVKFTIKRDGETISKGQYLEWETGLATGTLTGTQVGGNEMLRATVAPFEEYHADGWWGEETFKGGTLTAYSLQFHFRTAFAAVPGFGQKEQSVAETNLVFCKRSFDFVDAENPEWAGVHWTMTGDLTVNITEDRVGSDEAAKAEVNSRGLEYEYIGTHYLSFDQFIGGVKVTSQHRAENLLFPKN